MEMEGVGISPSFLLKCGFELRYLNHDLFIHSFLSAIL
jgi:hypothetical protein